MRPWFPFAQSIGAGAQGSDVINIGDIDLEVKARSAFQPKAWLDQLKSRDEGKLGIVVMRLNGQGDSVEAVAKYACMMRFEDVVALLIAAGYDKKTIKEPIRCAQCGGWMMEAAVCHTCQIGGISLA